MMKRNEFLVFLLAILSFSMVYMQTPRASALLYCNADKRDSVLLYDTGSNYGGPAWSSNARHYIFSMQLYSTSPISLWLVNRHIIDTRSHVVYEKTIQYVPTGEYNYAGEESLLLLENGTICMIAKMQYTWSSWRIYKYTMSSDNGTTWSDPVGVGSPDIPSTCGMHLFSLNTSHLIAIWQDQDATVSRNYSLCYRISGDLGRTWEPKVILLNNCTYNFDACKSIDNSINLAMDFSYEYRPGIVPGWLYCLQLTDDLVASASDTPYLLYNNITGQVFFGRFSDGNYLMSVDERRIVMMNVTSGNRTDLISLSEPYYNCIVKGIHTISEKSAVCLVTFVGYMYAYIWIVYIDEDAFGNIPPTTTSPADMSFQQFSAGNVLSWIVSDNTSSTFWRNYSIYRDGVPILAGSWEPGDPITAAIDGLGQGIFNYTIIVDDGYGGIVQDSVAVEVAFPINVTLIVSIAAAAIIGMGITVRKLKKTGRNAIRHTRRNGRNMDKDTQRGREIL